MMMLQYKTSSLVCLFYWSGMLLSLMCVPPSLAQGSRSLHGFNMVDPSAPTQAISIRYPAVATNLTLALPTTAPANGQVLVGDGSGNLSWLSGGGTAFSSITAAVATNTIDNGNNAQTWSWTGNGSSSQAFQLQGPSTYQFNQTLMRLSLTGVNATASQTTTTLRVDNTRSGTNTRNIGLMIEGTLNDRHTALLVTNGLTGFGTSTPTSIIQLGPGRSTANAGAPLKLRASSKPTDLIAGDVGCAYYGNVFHSSVATDMKGTMPSIMYRCLNDSVNGVSPGGLTWNNVFNTASALPTVTLAEGYYRFEILIGMTYDWSFGFRFNIGAGGTLEYSWMSIAYGDVSTNANGQYVTFNTGNENLAISEATAGTSPQMLIKGILKVTSTTADVTPQWYAKSSDNGVNTWRNSTMKIYKLGKPDINGVMRVGKWD